MSKNELRARWRDAAGFSRETVTARLFGEPDDVFVPRHYARLGDEVVDHPFGVDGGGSSIFAISSSQDAVGTIDGTPVLTVDGATGNVGIGATPSAGSRFEVQTTAGLALRVADADRTLHLPWNAATADEPNISLGLTGGLRAWHTGGAGYLFAYIGTVFVGASGAHDVAFMSNGAIAGRFDNSSNNAFVVGPVGALVSSKFEVQTTAGLALRVADDDRTLHLPWFGSSGAPNVSIGPSEQLRLYASNGTSRIESLGNGEMFIDNFTSAVRVRALSTNSGQPALKVQQNDVDEPFLEYAGTSAASASNSISSWTAGNTVQGFVRISVNGTDYWMPYYNAPTS